MENSNIEDLVRRFAAGLPAALGTMRQDLEANFRATLQGAASKLDLTSRSEFDVQAKVLERSRERIAQLEARLSALEARLQLLQESLPPVSD
jgi:BMFP domain-containing protein YqiC